MRKRYQPLRGRPARRVGGLLATLGLITATTACTFGQQAGQGKGGASSQPTTPPSAPMVTRVTHVAGTLGQRARVRLAREVGATISDYGQAAFLGGTYPRSDFSTSYGAFTSGAAADARRDADLLTNQPFGPTTRTVQATRRTAYLSVLAPSGKVAGVTAAVDLVFAVDRRGAADRTVHLKGRLLLTRAGSGQWAIFGYDIDRSDEAVGSSS